MTMTEAAACGTPAVVTEIAGHSDAVDDGGSGLLVGERGAHDAARCDGVLTSIGAARAAGGGALAQRRPLHLGRHGHAHFRESRRTRPAGAPVRDASSTVAAAASGTGPTTTEPARQVGRC